MNFKTATVGFFELGYDRQRFFIQQETSRHKGFSLSTIQALVGTVVTKYRFLFKNIFPYIILYLSRNHIEYDSIS